MVQVKCKSVWQLLCAQAACELITAVLKLPCLCQVPTLVLVPTCYYLTVLMSNGLQHGNRLFPYQYLYDPRVSNYNRRIVGRGAALLIEFLFSVLC